MLATTTNDIPYMTRLLQCEYLNDYERYFENTPILEGTEIASDECDYRAFQVWFIARIERDNSLKALLGKFGANGWDMKYVSESEMGIGININSPNIYTEKTLDNTEDKYNRIGKWLNKQCQHYLPYYDTEISTGMRSKADDDALHWKKYWSVQDMENENEKLQHIREMMALVNKETKSQFIGETIEKVREKTFQIWDAEIENRRYKQPDQKKRKKSSHGRSQSRDHTSRNRGDGSRNRKEGNAASGYSSGHSARTENRNLGPNTNPNYPSKPKINIPADVHSMSSMFSNMSENTSGAPNFKSESTQSRESSTDGKSEYSKDPNRFFWSPDTNTNKTYIQDLEKIKDYVNKFDYNLKSDRDTKYMDRYEIGDLLKTRTFRGGVPFMNDHITDYSDKRIPEGNDQIFKDYVRKRLSAGKFDKVQTPKQILKEQNLKIFIMGDSSVKGLERPIERAFTCGELGWPTLFGVKCSGNTLNSTRLRKMEKFLRGATGNDENVIVIKSILDYADIINEYYDGNYLNESGVHTKMVELTEYLMYIMEEMSRMNPQAVILASITQPWLTGGYLKSTTDPGFVRIGAECETIMSQKLEQMKLDRGTMSKIGLIKLCTTYSEFALKSKNEILRTEHRTLSDEHALFGYYNGIHMNVNGKRILATEIYRETMLIKNETEN